MFGSVSVVFRSVSAVFASEWIVFFFDSVVSAPDSVVTDGIGVHACNWSREKLMIELKKLRAIQTSQHLTTRTTRMNSGTLKKNEQPAMSGAFVPCFFVVKVTNNHTPCVPSKDIPILNYFTIYQYFSTASRKEAKKFL
jgi:hypothetical protein